MKRYLAETMRARETESEEDKVRGVGWRLEGRRVVSDKNSSRCLESRGMRRDISYEEEVEVSGKRMDNQDDCRHAEGK